MGKDVVRNIWARGSLLFLGVIMCCLFFGMETLAATELRKGSQETVDLPHGHRYEGSYDVTSSTTDVQSFCYQKEHSVWMPCRKRINCMVHYSDGGYDDNPESPYYRLYAYEITWDCSSYPMTEHLDYYLSARSEPHEVKETRYAISCTDESVGKARISAQVNGGYHLHADVSVQKLGCSLVKYTWENPSGGRVSDADCPVTQNGTYRLWIKYSDLGVERVVENQYLIKDADTTPPKIDYADYDVVTPNQEANLYVQAHDPEENGFCSGIAGYYVSISGGRPAAESGGWIHSNDEYFEMRIDGIYAYKVTRFYLWVKDEAGNVSEQPYVINVDLKPPTLWDSTPSSYAAARDLRLYDSPRKNLAATDRAWSDGRESPFKVDYGWENRPISLVFAAQDQENGEGIHYLVVYQSNQQYSSRTVVKESFVSNRYNKSEKLSVTYDNSKEQKTYYIVEAVDQKGNRVQARVQMGIDLYKPQYDVVASYSGVDRTLNGSLDLSRIVAINRKELQSFQLELTLKDTIAGTECSGFESCKVTMVNQDSGAKKTFTPEQTFQAGRSTVTYKIGIDFSQDFFSGEMGLLIEAKDISGNDVVGTYNIGIVSLDASVASTYPGDTAAKYSSGAFLKLTVEERGYLDSLELILPEAFARESYEKELEIYGDGTKQKQATIYPLLRSNNSAAGGQRKEYQVLIPVATPTGDYKIYVRGKRNNHTYVYNAVKHRLQNMENLEVTLNVPVRGSILDDLQTRIVEQ